MRETLFNARGLDETRVKRAFGWVVTFRDFPAGSYQTVDGDSMMTEALTLFTKGRAEFYLDGERRGDRVPGILSSEHDVVGRGGTFELRYVVPTTRVCIPRRSSANRNQLPAVKKLVFEEAQQRVFEVGTKVLVCLGSVKIGDRVFSEEQTFEVKSAQVMAEVAPSTILLDFTDAPRPSI